MLTPEQLEDYKQFRGTPIETLLQHVEEQARDLEAARAVLRNVYDIAAKQLAQPESDDTGVLILICDAALAPSEKGETG